jgi:Fe-Mn family superoxide dismutase
MRFTCRLHCPPLPYSFSALSPFISETALELHYEKHYRGYLDKLNLLSVHSKINELTLEKQIQKSAEKLHEGDNKQIFENASQLWNHKFFWHSMSSFHNQNPGPLMLTIINKDFDDFEDFKAQFNHKASLLFGSGWTWLIQNSSGKLEIMNFSNAGSPLLMDVIPLLVCDLWEHAYY